MACRGICNRYKTTFFKGSNRKCYDEDKIKRCTICQEYFLTETLDKLGSRIFCPCCGAMLRTKSRHTEARKKRAELVSRN